MSAVDREYARTRLTCAEEAATVDCPNCEATHQPGYQLITCDHKTCDIKGCHECILECSASVQCGKFCSDHLVAVEVGADWCYGCVAESLDDGPAAIDECLDDDEMELAA